MQPEMTMTRGYEPRIVMQLLERVETHGTAAAELFFLLYAIRGVALAVSTLASLTARTEGAHP